MAPWLVNCMEMSRLCLGFGSSQDEELLIVRVASPKKIALSIPEGRL